MNSILRFFEILPIYLIITIPFFLITGPFLTNLAISLISIIFLLEIIKKKNFFYLKNIFSFYFFIFFIFVLFNAIINFIDIKSFKNSFFYFRYGVFALAVAYYIKGSKKILKLFFFCLLAVYLALIIDGYWQFYSGKNILGYPLFDENSGPRVSSFFSDELILGSFLSRTYPLFFGLYILIFSKNKKQNLMMMILFALIEILICLSGERTSIFILFMFTLLYFIFGKKNKKIKIYSFLIAFLIILSVIFYKPALGNRIVYQTLDQLGFVQISLKYYEIFPLKDDLYMKKFLSEYKLKDNNQINNSVSINIFSQTHQGLYETGINMFKKNIFFGVGPNNFRYLCKDRQYVVGEGYCSTHPHNFYIQMLSELGLIGFLYLFFLFIYIALSLLRHLRQLLKNNYIFSDFEICLLIIFFINLFPLMPNGGFFSSWLSSVIFLPTGFYIWSNYYNKSQTDH